MGVQTADDIGLTGGGTPTIALLTLQRPYKTSSYFQDELQSLKKE